MPISTQTNDIAITSDKIAKLIVEDANKKRVSWQKMILLQKSIEQNSKI